MIDTRFTMSWSIQDVRVLATWSCIKLGSHRELVLSRNTITIVILFVNSLR